MEGRNSEGWRRMVTPVRPERVEDAARGALRGDGAAGEFPAGSGGADRREGPAREAARGGGGGRVASGALSTS